MVDAEKEALAAPVKPLVGTVGPLDVVNRVKDEDFRIAIREALRKIEGP